jgi:hypothetical protein
MALLGKDLSKSVGDDSVRLAAIEQICLASLDLHDHDLASRCLSKLKEGSTDAQSNRFKRLLSRCLETSGDTTCAENIYDELLQANQSRRSSSSK